MERYARHIVYRRWSGGGQFRPHASFDTLARAVEYVDGARADEYKVIDVEHIDLGNMLTAPECADLVRTIRATEAVR